MDGFFIGLVLIIFLAAGTIKGIVGAGMPLIAVTVLALLIDFREAVALVALPTFASNIWQAVRGQYFRQQFTRLWPYFAGAMAGVIPGIWLLSWVEAAWLTLVMGGVVTVYACLSLWGLHWPISQNSEKMVGIPVGVVTGVVAGMTGVLTVPSLLYFHSIIKNNREMFVQTAGISNMLVGAVLVMGLGGANLYSSHGLFLSAIALIPAYLGMEIGYRIRGRLDQRQFNFILLWFFVVLGIFLLSKGLWLGLR